MLKTAEAHLRMIGFIKQESPIDGLIVYRDARHQGITYDKTDKHWYAMHSALLLLAETLNGLQTRSSSS